MVIREAFAYGVPVAASRLGAMIELVEDGVNGFHFQANAADQIADRVGQMWSNSASLELMSRMAHQSYLRSYTEKINYEMLLAIYRSAMETRKRRK
jgi:glycosyltransferase involved in cell wall biosynthesis